MQTYSSGRNRVHASFSKQEIEAAILEYRIYAQKHPLDKLSMELLECMDDLREELSLRGVSSHE